MRTPKSANLLPEIEGVQRIEPARLENAVPEAVSDIVAELAAASAKLGHALNPRTAASLAGGAHVPNTMSRSAGTSLPQATASPASWRISPAVILSTAWARPRVSWRFPPRITASISFIRFRTAMVASAAS
jgi:hypothetical protein